MVSENETHLLGANEKYASLFTQGKLSSPPTKKYLIVTCMDARLDPAAAFGIELGDAHVIRNAGGSAVDALRSIVISEQLLGTQEILVVKHTKCGMVTFKNEDAYSIVEKNLGAEALAELKDRKLDFLPFGDLNKAIEDDVKFLRDTKLVPNDATISGWVYDVETGRTKQVV